MTETQKPTDNINKVKANLELQCVRREYCRSMIFTKAVKALEGNREAAETLVDGLVKDRFVDDARYASAFAREKSSLSGWGKVKISAMLRAKGIASDVIAAALEEVDPQRAEEKMTKVLETKARSLGIVPGSSDIDRKSWEKLLRFALSRGYSYDDVEAFLKGS